MSGPAILHDATVANLLIELRAAPDDRTLLRRLALAFNARSMPSRAEPFARRLLELDAHDGEAWYELLVARSFEGPDAVRPLRPEVEGLAARLPKAAWAWRNLALLDYYLEQDADAGAHARRALSLDPAEPHAEEVLAYLAYTLGDLDGAIEHGIKAVEVNGANFRALHWLGECYVRLDASEQAIRYFHRALRIEDGYFLALESLASLYLAHDATHAMALQCFSKILAINPRWFPAWFRLADAYLQDERFVEAEAAMRTVLRLSPDAATHADARQYLGLIALMQDDPAARDHFEAALKLDPGSAAAQHYLGVLSEREGDLPSAERRYRRAIAVDPEYSLPRTRLGYLCFDRRQLEPARRQFRAALAADPEDYLAHLGLGEIARVERRHDEQLEHCRRAVELAPTDANARNQYGTALDALGRIAEAAAAYEEALRLAPGNRQAANNLGHACERLLESARGPEATRLRRRAVEAWRQRLVSCRADGVSTRAAESHLTKLGVPRRQIQAWLKQSMVRRKV